MTPLHAQARALASCGVPVFPCVPDTKRPLVDGAYQVASTNLSQVDAWWAEYPDANVAIYPDGAGWCVVDLDPGGEAAWVALLAEHGDHTPTYMVSTPREGTHLYFAGSLPSTVGRVRSGLAPHVDTRGVGGYVLVPPSVVGGKPYRVLHDRDIVQCPGWMRLDLRRHVSELGLRLRHSTRTPPWLAQQAYSILQSAEATLLSEEPGQIAAHISYVRNCSTWVSAEQRPSGSC